MSILAIPQHAIERMKSRGAVRWSQMLLDKWDFLSGITRYEPFTALTYFWDAAGNELGYWSAPNEYLHEFEAPFRQWHHTFLENQQFHQLGP